MATTSGLSNPPKNRPKDWEDEYRRLHAKHEQLKIDFNEKEQHNKILQAKIRKLEYDLSQLEKQLGLPRSAVGVVNREEKEMIDILNDQVAKLKTTISLQSGKIGQLNDELEKKKREVTNLKKTLALRNASQKVGKGEKPMELEVVPGRASRTVSPEPAVKFPPLTGGEDSNLIELAKTLKNRNALLEKEIADLRRQVQASPAPLPPPSKPQGNQTVAELESQLRETSWRLQQLQMQYDYLSSKATSQSETTRSHETQLEDALSKIRELKRVLEELRYEKEVSDAKAAKVANLEELVSDLRAQNRSLEDKITRLCEAPFISDAFGQHESRLRQEELLKERENLLVQVEHLQEAVRTHFSALNSLKQQAAQLREDKEMSDRKAEEYRLKLQELEHGNNLVQEQLKLFSGADEGIDVETLEKALTMVKRRDIALEKLPFLEPVDGDSTGLITIPALKKKVQELQLLNLRLTEENEKLENMLKLQSTINKDLHKELDALVHSRDKEKGEMQQKAADFEQLALQRLDKIHTLEAQLRQFIYGVSKHTKSQGKMKPLALTPEKGEGEGKGTFFEEEEDADEALLAELLQDSKGDEIRPDENLLEIWIKSATVKDGVLTPGSSTFVVIDFFDYESQTTSVLSGVNPQWDFAATYKLTVDDFLLRYLATDVVTLEFNMASQGDFTLLGRCSIPLASLLKSKPRVKLDNHPIISVRTGQIIAHLSMVMRLALPISELYRLFLERHPNEKKYIEELAAKRLLEKSAKGSAGPGDAAAIVNNYSSALSEADQDRLYNELDVVIHRVEGLSATSPEQAPTPYVHFQLLGHPDKFTNPLFHTTHPLFNEKFTFPMMATEGQLRLMARSRVKFSVIDMDRDDEAEMKRSRGGGGAADGFLGDAEVSLAPLQEGLSISDRFLLKDRHGKSTGAEIFLTIRWKYPLQKQREVGVNALSGIDTEILIAAFSPHQSQEGVVDYQAFCKYISPSKVLQDHMTTLRLFLISLLEREGKTIKELLSFLFDLQPQTTSIATVTAGNTATTTSSQPVPSHAPVIDRDSFVKVFLKYQVPSLSPKDLELLFDFMDIAEEGRLSIDNVTAMLHLDESSGISMALAQKLRLRCQELHSRGVQPLKLFQAVDQWGANGIITRGEFKACLKKMGFTLIDEPLIEEGEVRHEILSKKPALEGDRLEDDDEGDMVLDHADELLLDQHQAEGKVSVRKNELGQFMKQQREIFEQQRAEIQKRSEEVLREQQQQGIADTQTSHDTLRDHRVSVESRKQRPGLPPMGVTSVTSSLDTGAIPPTSSSFASAQQKDLQAAATKIQSHFRGLKARQIAPLKHSPVVPSSPVKGIAAQAGMGGFTEEGVDGNIVDIEKTIFENIQTATTSSTGFTRPNLLEGFQKVDGKKMGFVSRKQFAHVLKQYPMLKLYGAELRSCMDYFDVQGDGQLIDYSAFLRFYANIFPEDGQSHHELSMPSHKLHVMILSPLSLQKIKEYDKGGSGFLSRSEMLHALTSIGLPFTSFSHHTLLTMLSYFETRQEGMINYLNFLEVIQENEGSRVLQRLSLELYDSIYHHQPPEENTLRRWFEFLDQRREGRFYFPQFLSFCSTHQLIASKEVLFALYSEWDPTGSGAMFSSLFSWMKYFYTHQIVQRAEVNVPTAQVGFISLTMDEIQKKCSAFLKSITGIDSIPQLIELVSQKFQVYSWRKAQSNTVPKRVFLHVLKKLGFPMTLAEGRMLSSQFSDVEQPHRVSFMHFLKWATTFLTTTAGGVAVSGSVALQQRKSTEGSASGGAIIHHPRQIISFLEKKMSQGGVDLLSMFARYDLAHTGRVTLQEFCAVMNELRLSSISVTEAKEVANTFRALSHDQIHYKVVLSELLKISEKYDEGHSAQSRRDDPLNKLIVAMERRQIDTLKLREAIEYYDPRRTGQIHREDLKEALRSLHLLEGLSSRDYLELIVNYLTNQDWILYIPFVKKVDRLFSQHADQPLPPHLRRGEHQLSPELLDKLRAMLELLILKGINYREELDQCDESYSGGVLLADFREIVLKRFRFELLEEEFHEIAKAFRLPDDPRRLDIARFVYTVHPRHTTRRYNEHGLKVYMAADALRRKIRRKYDYLTPGELRKPFKHFMRDHDRDIHHRLIAFPDFVHGLHRLEIRLTMEEERSLFDSLCMSQEGQISYIDFVLFVLDPQHQDIIWKFHRTVNRLQLSEKRIEEELKNIDELGSGILSAKQFRKVLKHRLGMSDFSDSDLLRLMLRFDPDESQRLHLHLFFAFLHGKQKHGQYLDQQAEQSQQWDLIRARLVEKLEAGYTKGEIYKEFLSSSNDSLDLVSLLQGLRYLGLNFTRHDARSILKKIHSLLTSEGEDRRPKLLDKNEFFKLFNIDISSLQLTAGKSRREKPDYAHSRYRIDSDEEGDLVRDRGDGYESPSRRRRENRRSRSRSHSRSRESARTRGRSRSRSGDRSDGRFRLKEVIRRIRSKSAFNLCAH